MNVIAWWLRRREAQRGTNAAHRFTAKAVDAGFTPKGNRYLCAAERCYQRADRIRKGGRW